MTYDLGLQSKPRLGQGHTKNEGGRSNGSDKRVWTNTQTNKQTNGRYQTHYLPCFAVDKNDMFIGLWKYGGKNLAPIYIGAFSILHLTFMACFGRKTVRTFLPILHEFAVGKVFVFGFTVGLTGQKKQLQRRFYCNRIKSIFTIFYITFYKCSYQLLLNYPLF